MQWLGGSMIIHIGWETCVQSEDVVAILNKSTALGAPGGPGGSGGSRRSGRPGSSGPGGHSGPGGRNATAAFIQQAKRAGRFTHSPEGERAYIVTIEQGEAHVYASAINAATLNKRIEGSIQE